MEIVIFGFQRSGSSWLGKLFDSHPDVEYLHEPELAQPSGLPVFASATPDHLERAQKELRRWHVARDIRTRGTRPIFRKHGESRSRYSLRLGQIYAGKGLERISKRFAHAGPVIRPFNGAAPYRVLKTINLLGRAQVFLQAAPEIYPILLLRHPGGYIASVLRGLPRFGDAAARSALSYSALVDSPVGQEEGLTLERLEAMPPVERLAWKWLAFNDAAYRVLESSSQAVTVRYEDVAKSPQEQMQILFGQVNLPWKDAVDAFIASSTQGPGNERYYAVKRDSEQAAQRWRSEISESDRRLIEKICARRPVGRIATG